MVELDVGTAYTLATAIQPRGYFVIQWNPSRVADCAPLYSLPASKITFVLRPMRARVHGREASKIRI